MKAKPIENTSKKQVNIYTYSLSDNKQHGLSLWVSLLSFGSAERIISGVAHNTNKNRAELYSIYAALKALKEPCEVHIFSDSQFVVNAYNLQWIERWSMRGWILHKVDPVPNQDVWKALLPLFEYHSVSMEWVRDNGTLPKMQICSDKAEQMYLIENKKCG